MAAAGGIAAFTGGCDAVVGAVEGGGVVVGNVEGEAAGD